MEDDYPSAKMLSVEGGYSQVYMIHKEDRDAKNADGDAHEVLFRCGNWAYRGFIQFNEGIKLNTTDLPLLIPVLQKQQGSLRYYCNASAIPSDCDYYMPMKFFEDAVDFFAAEMNSDTVGNELVKMSNVFSWIDEDDANTYFELELSEEELPDCMKEISLIASKTYTRGLIIVSILAEGSLFFVVQSGEGDQALLDVKFPDVSKHGQGLNLATYSEAAAPFKKLTLWHSITSEVPLNSIRKLPKLKTADVSSCEYQQTYCIMKSSWDEASPVLSVHHDVLFRFGSWCYAGRVQLTSTLNLEDVPLIIPALRMQQSRLDFLCDTRNVPTTSPFAGSLTYVSNNAPLLDLHLEQAGIMLEGIILNMEENDPAEARRLREWMDGDDSQSFFELTVEHDSATKEDLHNIEMVASKSYHPSGVVTLAIYYQSSIFVTVQDGSSENPLLDSRFPDVVGKGRGFQIQSFTEADAPEHWPQLRKVQLWQRSDSSLDQRLPSNVADAKESRSRAESGDSVEEERHLREGREGDGWIRDPTDSHSLEAKRDGVNAAEQEPSSPTTLVMHRSFRMEDEAESKSTPQKERVDVSSVARTDGTDRADEDLSVVDQAQDRVDIGATTPETKASTAADAKFCSPGTLTSIDFSKSTSSTKAARPHHLPSLKLEGSLGSRMESIRRGMEGDAKSGEEAAPWDLRGRPLGKLEGDAKSGEEAAPWDIRGRPLGKLDSFHQDAKP